MLGASRWLYNHKNIGSIPHLLLLVATYCTLVPSATISKWWLSLFLLTYKKNVSQGWPALIRAFLFATQLGLSTRVNGVVSPNQTSRIFFYNDRWISIPPRRGRAGQRNKSAVQGSREDGSVSPIRPFRICIYNDRLISTPPRRGRAGQRNKSAGQGSREDGSVLHTAHYRTARGLEKERRLPSAPKHVN